MGLRITGVDWDSFSKANGRPMVFGIEDLMVSVLVLVKKLSKQGWEIKLSVLRITTRPEKVSSIGFKRGDLLAGSLVAEGSAAENNYGILEVKN